MGLAEFDETLNRVRHAARSASDETAWRSTTDRKTPRFKRRLVSVAKKVSTALSQEHEVGGRRWHDEKAHASPSTFVGISSRGTNGLVDRVCLLRFRGSLASLGNCLGRYLRPRRLCHSSAGHSAGPHDPAARARAELHDYRRRVTGGSRQPRPYWHDARIATCL